MYRWSKCPGSVNLSRGINKPSSIYARQGSCAHELVGFAMETAFAKNIPTYQILQKDYLIPVLVYARYIEAIKWAHPDAAIHIEHSFDMSFIFPDLYGTCDCAIWHPKSQLLEIIDYKHGAGVPVDVEGNQQLSYYALGAIETLGYKALNVKMTIIQPRCYHPAGQIRSWTVPNTYFIDFKADLIDAAKKTLEKDAPLVADGSRLGHCMFCPAKTICPAKLKAANTGAKNEFKFYTDPKKDFAGVL